MISERGVNEINTNFTKKRSKLKFLENQHKENISLDEDISRT